jgi:hypothetical protein
VAARFVPLDDRAPRLGGLRHSSFPLEQERATVERPDIVGIELERKAPVGQRAFCVA